MRLDAARNHGAENFGPREKLLNGDGLVVETHIGILIVLMEERFCPQVGIRDIESFVNALGHTLTVRHQLSMSLCFLNLSKIDNFFASS